MNLQADDLCGISPFFVKPVWLDSGESARNWVAFGNGVAINLRKYAEGRNAPEDYTRQVSPHYFSGDFVSYDWSPESTCPMFMKFLNRIMPTPEGQGIVQEMLGLLIADTCRYEVFFQLYGNGANGKTTLLDILQALVGRHNVSFIQLAILNERFQSWPLAESKVNVCGEMPTDIGRGSYAAMEGAFKDCVSGGMVECERKGRDKYSAPCRARFVMSANTLPTFVDRSDGIWRRLRIINFPIKISDEEKDSDLARKIIEKELSGILMFAIEGLRRVIANDGIGDTEEGRQMKEAHRRSCDHEQEFLLEHYHQGESGAKTDAKKLYDQYHEWMLGNGYRALGAAKFYSRVESVYPFTQRKKMRIDGVLTHGFQHLVETATTDIFD
jgi:putative DNA primase/helicase